MNFTTADGISIADLQDHPWASLDGELVQADVLFIDDTLGGWVCEFDSMDVLPISETYADPENVPDE